VRRRESRGGGSLVQAELCAASDRLIQIAERIGCAFLEFGVALVRFQVLRRHRMMADRANLSCFTISAAFSGSLRHPRERNRQRDRSNDNTMRRPSPGSWLRHPGYLFNSREHQLRGQRPCRKIPALFGSRTRASGAVPAPIRRLDAAATPCRALERDPRSDPPRPRGRPTIGGGPARCRAPPVARA
jgi:hypothetical protein